MDVNGGGKPKNTNDTRSCLDVKTLCLGDGQEYWSTGPVSFPKAKLAMSPTWTMQCHKLGEDVSIFNIGGGTGIHSLQHRQYVSRPPTESCQTIVKL